MVSGFGCRLGRGGLSHLYGNRDGGAPGGLSCGLAVDLSRITPVPVTPVLCVGFLCRSLLARRSRFLSVLCPALWSLPVMYVAGTFDPCVLLGLGTGGLAAGLFPGQARPDASAPAPSSLETASRLETAAGVLEYLQEILSRELPSAVGQDTATLYDQAANTVCRSCTRWETCWNREAEETCQLLSASAPRLLDQRYIAPEDLPPAFLDRCRRPEAFLESINGGFVRPALAPSVPGPAPGGADGSGKSVPVSGPVPPGYGPKPHRTGAPGPLPGGAGDCFCRQVWTSGFRRPGAHFPGPGLRYYVLLCDGMGTGPGAAQESESALRILTGLLQAGMPASEALGTLNDLYVLRDRRLFHGRSTGAAPGHRPGRTI